MLTQGKWLRIECESGVYHYQYDGTYDCASGDSFPEMLADAKAEGWEKIKGKWYCPKCAEEIKKQKT